MSAAAVKKSKDVLHMAIIQPRIGIEAPQNMQLGTILECAALIQILNPGKTTVVAG